MASDHRRCELLTGTQSISREKRPRDESEERRERRKEKRGEKGEGRKKKEKKESTIGTGEERRINGEYNYCNCIYLNKPQ
jgi:hypothetical protein